MADEYIKRKNVLECIKESRDGMDWGQSEDGDAFLHYSACLYRTIASNECFPSADVAEVVRCKDCRHRDPEDHKCDCGKLERAGCAFPVNDDYFCAYGERRGGT